jgi:hypothetical protein
MIMSTRTLAVATVLFAAVFGTGLAASALFGMILAILHYEWVHYVAHIPYQPRTRLGRWVKQYHLRHHFISGSASAIRRWTVCSARFAGRARRRKALRPASFIPETMTGNASREINSSGSSLRAQRSNP